VTQQQIIEAETRIRPYIRRTPVIELEMGAFDTQAKVVLKLESLQHSGSFKPRGAFNRMLSNPIPDSGVIAASGGNHGAAVAYAAGQLGLPAEIFVPTIASPSKVEKIRGYGATIHIGGSNYQEALEASQARAAQTGALAVHAYDQPEVLAGQGTVGKEFEEQAPGLDTLLIAVGGGGLIGGIAAWFGGRLRVLGVESEGCPTLYRSLKAGELVSVKPSGLAADSLGATRVGSLMFEVAKTHLAGAVLVSDEAIREAQRWLWHKLQVVAEPGGATALAALMTGAYAARAGERVGVLVCGANTDLSKIV
jgi:threonine dehydratase